MRTRCGGRWPQKSKQPGERAMRREPPPWMERVVPLVLGVLAVVAVIMALVALYVIFTGLLG